MRDWIPSLALTASLMGCQQPCKEGFARSNDGMCDGVIEAIESQDEAQPDLVDTGGPSDSASPEDERQGTITVRASPISGWQYHAYVIEAYPDEKHFAESALCSIILDEPATVGGTLKSWNPIYEPVCSVDTPDADVHVFASGPVLLKSFIYAGEGASPSACGEVMVTVDGDIEITAPEVGDCP